MEVHPRRSKPTRPAAPLVIPTDDASRLKYVSELMKWSTKVAAAGEGAVPGGIQSASGFLGGTEVKGADGLSARENELHRAGAGCAGQSESGGGLEGRVVIEFENTPIRDSH